MSLEILSQTELKIINLGNFFYRNRKIPYIILAFVISTLFYNFEKRENYFTENILASNAVLENSINSNSLNNSKILASQIPLKIYGTWQFYNDKKIVLQKPFKEFTQEEFLKHDSDLTGGGTLGIELRDKTGIPYFDTKYSLTIGNDLFTGGAKLNPEFKENRIGGALDTLHGDEVWVRIDSRIQNSDGKLFGMKYKQNHMISGEFVYLGDGIGKEVRTIIHDFFKMYPGDKTEIIENSGKSAGIGGKGALKITPISSKKGKAEINLNLLYDYLWNYNSDYGRTHFIIFPNLEFNFSKVSFSGGINLGYMTTPKVLEEISNTGIPKIIFNPFFEVGIHLNGKGSFNYRLRFFSGEDNGVHRGTQNNLDFPLTSNKKKYNFFRLFENNKV